MQVFTDNPTAWHRRAEPPAELDAFREHLERAGVEMISVHAPYLVNLCGASDDFWQRSVATMANEMRVASAYGARFVVMHIGSHRDLERDVGIGRLVAGLTAVLGQAPSERLDGGRQSPLLVLENSAGVGDGIGSSIEDLADILDSAARAGIDLDALGICLDTAHLWGAGYDIDSQAGVENVINRIDRLIGRDRVVMLHLNDSRAALGSHLDRHEHIGAGQVGAEGIGEVLRHPWLASLPTFLETPGMDLGYDLVNLERARMLIAGEAPPTLPAEAIGLRGSRHRTAPPTP